MPLNQADGGAERESVHATCGIVGNQRIGGSPMLEGLAAVYTYTYIYSLAVRLKVE